MNGIGHGIGIGFSRRSVAGVPAVEGLDFGAKTLAGAGGTALPSGAASITNAGGTNLTVTGGFIVPATAGVASGTVTFDNGATRVVTAVANSYSVRTIAEVEAAAEAANLALGDQILLRDGDYNATYADTRITRTTLPSGVWSGSNYITVKPHTGAVAKLRRLSVYGSTIATGYFSFEGLVLTADARATTGTDATAALRFDGVTHCRVRNCTSDTAAFSATTWAHLSTFIYAVGASSNLVIEDNTLNGCRKGIVLKGANCVVRGNTLRNCVADGMQLVPPLTNLIVEGNTVTDKLAVYDVRSIVSVTRGNPTQITLGDVTGLVVGDDLHLVGTTGLESANGIIGNISAIVGNVVTWDRDTSGATAYVSGGEARTTGIHGDFIQAVGSSAVLGDMDDCVFRGNRLTRGVGTPFSTDGQGIFLADNPAGVLWRRVIIEGNILDQAMGNAITVHRSQDGVIRNNVAVTRLGLAATLSGVPSTIRITGEGSGNIVRDNVANAYSLGGFASVDANNAVVTVNDSAAYAAAFDAPPSGEVTTVANVAYAPKAGGPLAVLSPVPGAVPHQSFVSPWTFTAPSDTTAPTLSSPTDAANGATAATGSVTTDEGNGTLYWVVTTSSTAPTATQVEAGQNASGSAAVASGSQAVSATGAQNVAPSGLTASTAYWLHFMHKDAAGNRSTVASGDGFTTAAGGYTMARMDNSDTAYVTYLSTAVASNAKWLMSGWITVETHSATGSKVLFQPSGRTAITYSSTNGALAITLRDSANVVVYSAVWNSFFGVATEAHLVVAVDLSVPSCTVSKNGATVAPDTVSTALIAGTGLLALNRATGILASDLGASISQVKVGDLFLQAGGTLPSAATLYNGGAPPDLTGVGTPYLWMGGTMTAANWNAAQNRASGGITVSVPSATFSAV